MACSDPADRFVFLRDGCTVPVEAYLLALDLEKRRFTITATDNDARLLVRPPDRLTAEDCYLGRRWKAHLILLCAYCRHPHDRHLFTDDRAPEREDA
jgi:hypothetical protein